MTNNVNLLFYYPSNKRSIQIETLLEALKEEGFQVYFLCMGEAGAINYSLDQLGIKTYSARVHKKNALQYYLSQILFLIKFVRSHKIEIVLSNLQQANLVSILAQYFFKARLICFRHHFKFFTANNRKNFRVNKNEKIGDILINRLAKEIVVPSNGVYQGMVNQEKVNPNKIRIIPYMYRFDHYGKPNDDHVNQIKKSFPFKLRMIMVSRLIPLKRHMIVLSMIKDLIDQGLNICLFILDEGPEKENIASYIRKNQLEKNVIMLGFRKDFLNYMAASDLIIHPSITEASNSAVKEMALLSKPSIVCKNVGDFDDYIKHESNGFLCDIDNFASEAKSLIIKYYYRENALRKIGTNARKTVLNNFSVNEKNKKKYLDLLS